jgi:hypothetical protein
MQALQILEGHDIDLSKVKAVELTMIKGLDDQLLPNFKTHNNAKVFLEELKREDKKVSPQLKTTKAKKDDKKTEIIII